MIAAVNRGVGEEGFQKEFGAKDVIHIVDNVWNSE